MPRSSKLLGMSVGLMCLTPAVAFACINSVVRRFWTYPADFTHVGLVVVAVVLFFGGKHMSTTRQLAVLAAGIVGGVGYGLWGAKLVGFDLTPLLGGAVVSTLIVCASIALFRRPPRPAFGLDVSRWVLLIAMAISSYGTYMAHYAKVTQPGFGGMELDENGEVPSQMFFF